MAPGWWEHRRGCTWGPGGLDVQAEGRVKWAHVTGWMVEPSQRKLKSDFVCVVNKVVCDR